MRRVYVTGLLLALALLAGCAGAKQPPVVTSRPPAVSTPGPSPSIIAPPSSSPAVVVPPAVSATVVPPPSVTPTPPAAAPALDKYSLWKDGTQLRGVNVYQRIVYPNAWDDPAVWGDGPLGPVFTQDDFQKLAAAGANLVVLSHPGLYDDRPPYALNTGARDNLDNFLDMAEKAGLYVVIAFRTGPGRSEFSFFGVGEDDEFGQSHLNDEVWKNQAAQDKWAEMWRYTAERYRGRPSVIGYELMVEPNGNGVWLDIWEPSDFYPAYENTAYDWNRMFPPIVEAIREVDTETPVLVSSLSYGNIRWLPYLKPVEDDRMVYTVHQYTPQQQYTHQLPDAAGRYRNTYPGRFDTDWDGQPDDFNAAWLDEMLQPVDGFSKEYGVPVAVTEYGLVRTEPGGSFFLDDEMAAFETHGLNYAIWSWQPFNPVYTRTHNDFNFRLGSGPASLEESDGDLYVVLKKYWKKNTVRLSGSP